MGLLIIAGLAVYFFFPLRSNVLPLGADRTEGSEAYGRTDTMILSTIVPLKPYVGMLSIPRDLWVPIPGHGENRINTAHFFAELKEEKPGSGPQAALAVVAEEIIFMCRWINTCASSSADLKTW